MNNNENNLRKEVMSSPWIKRLFINEPKKGYYIDGHKIEGTINYCKHFFEQYLGCKLIFTTSTGKEDGKIGCYSSSSRT
jgi:hypothetical protein